MKVETSELTGAALDWAVAKCEGTAVADVVNGMRGYHYSTNWAQGGPIIEREKYDITFNQATTAFAEYWTVTSNDGNNEECGDTLLIAAMRCYVASKLGDEIEIPEELK